jgi:hypothetical protein
VVDKKDEESEIPTLEFDAGWDDWGEAPKKGEGDGNDRPTLVPKFDVEAFARENATSKTSAALRSTPLVGMPKPPAIAREPVKPATPGLSGAPPKPPARPFGGKPSSSGQPFSQRTTPPRGVATPAVGTLRQAAPTPVPEAMDEEPQPARPGAPTTKPPAVPVADAKSDADRSGRPTTLRVDAESLLALANKVAGSYTPAPTYDDAPAPPGGPRAPTRSDHPQAITPIPPPEEASEAPILEVGEAAESDVALEADPSSEMRDRFALGDYSGALVMAELLLEENPTLGEALEYADSCRAMLTKMYTARIGPLDRVPVVEVARDQLRWLSLDHRSGFVLSLVDGVSSLEMILDVSGMRELDCLRILFELVQQRIISFR